MTTEYREPKYYDAEDTEGVYLEVMLEDEEGNEYNYWITVAEIPEGECDIDWPIEKAKAYHAQKELPKIPEDVVDEEDPFNDITYANVGDPFSRYENEFTFI